MIIVSVLGSEALPTSYMAEKSKVVAYSERYFPVAILSSNPTTRSLPPMARTLSRGGAISVMTLLPPVMS